MGNPVPSASGHLKGAIRLSVPISLRNDKEGGSEYRDLRGNRIFGDFSGQQFMVKTEFELPHEVKFEAGPIIFRWMWFCGVDVANGERQAWGMGELFHACMDARISNTCGAPPAPTTQAPTTKAPEEITCRRYSGSNMITGDDWCANNCLVNGILMYTMCCDEAKESQCPKEMH